MKIRAVLALMVMAVVMSLFPVSLSAQAIELPPAKYEEGQWVTFSGTAYRGFGCIFLKEVKEKLDRNYFKKCTVYGLLREAQIDSERLGVYYWINLYEYPGKDPVDRVLALESNLQPGKEPWWINYQPPEPVAPYDPLKSEPLYPSRVGKWYTAVWGDTASAIARRNGISLLCLCKANSVSVEQANILKVGQLVYVPPVSWCRGFGY